MTATNLPKAVLMFGPPGAGKGTVGVKLTSVCPEFYHLSSGDIFRGLSPESESGRVFFQYSTQGKLVPDQVTIDICGRYIEGLINTNKFNPASQILLLDGLPRTPEQAEILRSRVEVIRIYQLELPDENEIIRRILGRAAIEGRKDDADESIIRNRIAEYHKKTASVLEKYDPTLIAKINGSGTPLQVFVNVVQDWAAFTK
jgi:adenylate kinase